MKRSGIVLLAAFAALPVGACGGNRSSTATASSGQSVASPSAGKLRLGHYSSGDGMVGFVLDRTGPAPKVRMDGTSEVLVLESQPQGRDGQDGYLLVNHALHIGIAVDPDGGVLFSKKGGGSRSVYRDGDAQGL